MTTSTRTRTTAVAVEIDPRVQMLLDGGFTQAQVESIVGTKGKKAKKAKKAKAAKVETPAPAPELTAKDRENALVASNGLAHARGRVYVTTAILKAGGDVAKSGTPTVVETSGTGRTTHVLISRTESGDVSIQNLYKP